MTALLFATVAACGGPTSRPATPAPSPDVSRDDVPATPTMVAGGNPRTDLIPRAVLFGNPERSAPLVSPDGKRVAFTAPASGVMNVFVAPIDDLAAAVQVTTETQRPIREYSWSADGAFVLYEQDVGGDENFHLFRVRPDGTDPRDLTPKPGILAIKIGLSQRHPREALVAINDRNPEVHDIYRIDLATGATTLAVENPGYINPVADQDLKIRLASQFQPDGSVALFAHTRKGWVAHDQIPSDDQLTTNQLGFTANGKQYYEIDARGRDTAALFLVDATSKKRTLLAEHARGDASEVITHPTTGAVRAVSFDVARPEWKVLDKAIARDLAALARLDEGDVEVLSMSDDDRTWIVGFNGDRQPARFWRWDRTAQRGTFLYSARPALEGLPLARMHPREIAARDGLSLVSYLSLPVASDPDGDGVPAAPVPLVLLVHGGPWARDTWGYNPMVQLLNNRGYAVLRVNFRGSTGFGKAFTNAANREWGKKMHDDLLDGVAWAVDQKVTTAGDVCVMGASYGGYATLAGLTLTPTAFKCGVDIVGPSNLITLAESVPPYWKPIISVFQTRMGDWTTPEGKAEMLAVSPLTHVGKIERPLLIGQGANDPRVKQAESDQIVRAMQAKALPVTYVLFPDEGHGFRRPENMQAFVALAEAFLSAHLGGAYQPSAPEDFTGSTIQVKAGAEGIPGLPAGVGR